MDKKISEALKKLVPADQVVELEEALSAFLDQAIADKDKQCDEKLAEAYAQMSKELAENEKIGKDGYDKAISMIAGLRNQLEIQSEEFKGLEEEYKNKVKLGFDEAYQMLEDEKKKALKLEADLYEEYDKKVDKIKMFMTEKLDQFLQFKGAEIYESVKRELLSDPRVAEQKIALDRVMEAVGRYMVDDGIVSNNSAKLEETSKKIDELKGQIRIIEARNIKLSLDNTKLTENLRQTQAVVSEATEVVSKAGKAEVIKEQNERAVKATNVTGRGKTHAEDNVVISENQNGNVSKEYSEMQVLAGIKK